MIKNKVVINLFVFLSLNVAVSTSMAFLSEDEKYEAMDRFKSNDFMACSTRTLFCNPSTKGSEKDKSLIVFLHNQKAVIIPVMFGANKDVISKDIRPLLGENEGGIKSLEEAKFVINLSDDSIKTEKTWRGVDLALKTSGGFTSSGIKKEAGTFSYSCKVNDAYSKIKKQDNNLYMPCSSGKLIVQGNIEKSDKDDIITKIIDIDLPPSPRPYYVYELHINCNKSEYAFRYGERDQLMDQKNDRFSSGNKVWRSLSGLNPSNIDSSYIDSDSPGEGYDHVRAAIAIFHSFCERNKSGALDSIMSVIK